MRVISGAAKGRKLAPPRGRKIRPALDKVKQALFNILVSVDGMKILDLFAGTGSIGIEALSRGAKEATFVDAAGEALSLIRKNLERCEFMDRAKLLRLKLPFELGRIEGSFNLIFVDPPYDKRLINPTLRRIRREKVLAADGTVIVEHSPRERIAEDVGLHVVDQRKYGQTFLSFLKETGV